MKWIDKELPKIEYMHVKTLWFVNSKRAYHFIWKDGYFDDLDKLPKSKNEILKRKKCKFCYPFPCPDTSCEVFVWMQELHDELYKKGGKS